MRTDQYLLMENAIASRERPGLAPSLTRPSRSGCHPRADCFGTVFNFTRLGLRVRLA